MHRAQGGRYRHTSLAQARVTAVFVEHDLNLIRVVHQPVQRRLAQLL
jgi:hypothetical protein